MFKESLIYFWLICFLFRKRTVSNMSMKSMNGKLNNQKWTNHVKALNIWIVDLNKRFNFCTFIFQKNAFEVHKASFREFFLNKICKNQDAMTSSWKTNKDNLDIRTRERPDIEKIQVPERRKKKIRLTNLRRQTEKHFRRRKFHERQTKKDSLENSRKINFRESNSSLLRIGCST